ncbi:MAG: NAD(P)/FAD-dependent oxidoreductase [Nitrospirae bacterium]|nr:MAG: NAD(P)/FAD-dependent oxidoreductase [Nitrospirota bacterium]
MAKYDVVIIGAGPYGLSAAAHLQTIRRLQIRVFGEPMSFWEHQMPKGMLLRSPYAASHLSDPARVLSLDAYQAANGNHLSRPIPIDRFIDYGRWFQRQTVPETDPRKITCVERTAGEFRLAVEDGEEVRARRVVVAAGIGPFANIPAQFRHLPDPLVFHASRRNDLSAFPGKKFAVIGAGQSALESAALLHEGGAEVEVLVRGPRVHWLTRSSRLHKLGPVSRLLYAPTDVGPAGVSRIVAVPNLVRYLPRFLQNDFRIRSTGPRGAIWLVPRLQSVPITVDRTATSATAVGDRVRLQLDDGSQRLVDHVLLGTGYRIDISRYSFLSRELLSSIRCDNGFPALDRNFEASVPGLHFLGAPAGWSFGPLMYFVAGADFATHTLGRYVARTGKTGATVRVP